MDPRLLDYYNGELAYLREMGAEFAQEFPKVAARLTMEGVEVSDPYVERLLEGFAFMAARLHMKIDSEFPKFTQNLLETIYPDFLAPTPSIGVVELTPDYNDAALADGPSMPRGASINAPLPRGETSHCRFTTAHPVRLWPIELASASYFKYAPDLSLNALSVSGVIRGGLRMKLKSTAALLFNQIDCDELVLHIKAPDEVSLGLFEAILAQSLGGAVFWGTKAGQKNAVLRLDQITAYGFEDDLSLMPFDARSFQGYRIVREYFSFAQRYLFIKISGLGAAFKHIAGHTCELVLMSSQADDKLEPLVDAKCLSLYATPVCNVFEQKADRMFVKSQQHDQQLIVDRTRPADFEVYRVLSVDGFTEGSEQETRFAPFYGGHHESWNSDARTAQPYFTIKRTSHVLSSAARRKGTRTGYVGSEVFVSLVDENQAPFSSKVQQLSANVLATNRDLPLLIPIGSLANMTPPPGLPVTSTKMISGPSKPVSRLADGALAWQLIGHLNLNYHSLFGRANEAGGTSGEGSEGLPAHTLLKQMLSLYISPSDNSGKRIIEAISSLNAKPIVRRLPIAGPITFGRGLAITLKLNESGFAGTGAYLLGCVLERFFARHVSVNSFTQLTLESDFRGEIAKWPPRAGLKPIG